jgi:hypothetical protein
MRTLWMVLAVSLFPLVAAADPADLPNANLPGNSASLPNSNLPGSLPDNEPITLPNTDTEPPIYWPGPRWWPLAQPSIVRVPNLMPAPSPEHAF